MTLANVQRPRFNQHGLGCEVLLLPDTQNAVQYLRDQCVLHGWEVGEPQPLQGSRLVSVPVQGPSVSEFEQAFRGNSEFEFVA